MGLALNNLQWLIYHKTKPNQFNKACMPNIYIYIYIYTRVNQKFCKICLHARFWNKLLELEGIKLMPHLT